MELNPGQGLKPSLSAVERSVGSLVAAGYANSEIAAQLGLSAQSVEWRVAKLCHTRGVASREELVARLAQRGRGWGRRA
jgi:DNA-binding CsgD family transcriptional regulator